MDARWCLHPWLFTMSDSDIGNRSNFAASLAYVQPGVGNRAVDDCADALYAQRTLLKWIRELGDFDAGVLQAAYVARPWPIKLYEELGRLTGIVARLGAVEDGLPETREDLETLELRTATRLNEALARKAPVLTRLVREARPLLERAFDAYVRKRGGEAEPVFRGIQCERR
jgi:hypothetical protein